MSLEQNPNALPVEQSIRPVSQDEIARISENRHVPDSTSSPPTLSTVEPEKSLLWLRRADQLLLGFLLIALLGLLIAFRWKLSAGGRAEIEIASQQPREYFYSIDVNNASWVEWAQLDGIGEKLAKRIVQDRTDQGPFRSIDDIRRVRGFGQKLIEKIRPFLKWTDNESLPESKSVEVPD